MNEVCNESTTLVPLELGFVQKSEPWQLTSHSFPSKVGGRPAWLALEHIPKDMKCEECDKKLSFLLQVYSPIEGQSNCYHRTIFLFICNNGLCYQEGKKPTIRAFRSQIPRENPYYKKDIRDEFTIIDISNGECNIKPLNSMISLCATCGCHGEMLCPKCEKVTYCSKEHIEIDLEENHSTECFEFISGIKTWTPLFNISKTSSIFPEYELVMGPDPHSESVDDDSECEKGDGEKLGRDSDGENKSEPMVVDSGSHHEAIESDANINTDCRKKLEERYYHRISREPSQVLRYHRGGEPLWISDKNRVTEPPSCPRCGAHRQFEFQVLPQLLNHLNFDLQGNSIDWGSLFIYTCSASCELTVDAQSVKDHEPRNYVYAEEFVWKQD